MARRAIEKLLATEKQWASEGGKGKLRDLWKSNDVAHDEETSKQKEQDRTARVDCACTGPVHTSSCLRRRTIGPGHRGMMGGGAGGGPGGGGAKEGGGMKGRRSRGKGRSMSEGIEKGAGTSTPHRHRGGGGGGGGSSSGGGAFSRPPRPGSSPAGMSKAPRRMRGGHCGEGPIGVAARPGSAMQLVTRGGASGANTGTGVAAPRSTLIAGGRGAAGVVRSLKSLKHHQRARPESSPVHRSIKETTAAAATAAATAATAMRRRRAGSMNSLEEGSMNSLTSMGTDGGRRRGGGGGGGGGSGGGGAFDNEDCFVDTDGLYDTYDYDSEAKEGGDSPLQSPLDRSVGTRFAEEARRIERERLLASALLSGKGGGGGRKGSKGSNWSRGAWAKAADRKPKRNTHRGASASRAGRKPLYSGIL